MGWPLISKAPIHLLKFPVMIGVPAYSFTVLQGGINKNIKLNKPFIHITMNMMVM